MKLIGKSMDINTFDDVEKFLDKFQDPTREEELILETLGIDPTGIQIYFMRRLLMKTYRYGKEHGYAGSLDVIRRR
jgi:hypothetical protein